MCFQSVSQVSTSVSQEHIGQVPFLSPNFLQVKGQAAKLRECMCHQTLKEGGVCEPRYYFRLL